MRLRPSGAPLPPPPAQSLLAQPVKIGSARRSLPGIVFPLLLGSAFEWFPSKRATYSSFFLISAGLNVLQTAVLLLVHVPRADGGGEEAADASAKAEAPAADDGLNWCTPLSSPLPAVQSAAVSHR